MLRRNLPSEAGNMLSSALVRGRPGSRPESQMLCWRSPRGSGSRRFRPC
ncbi:unnamed protein product [Spirodela intermedia]|uniref:Uncharacterized protein n=1 Tax=Spirodela intermedia TaxID=51605 RepID=A0ABN7EBB0_SPIIN|nr:unnamed protein product [Spirodela intermedia]